MKMFNQTFENNGVNGNGTPCEGPLSGRCFPAQQWGPNRYPATARVKWNKEVNKVVTECFYRSKPFDEKVKPIRGYRKRMSREWRERRMFESTEQRVCDQARAIRKNGWLSELELEGIKRQVEDESYHRAIVRQLKKIMVEGRTGDNIMFKKVEKKVLRVQGDRVNEAIKYLKSKSITQQKTI